MKHISSQTEVFVTQHHQADYHPAHYLRLGRQQSDCAARIVLSQGDRHQANHR